MRVTLEMTIALTMINGLGHMALVAVFYGIIKRLDIGRRRRAIALGCLFGVGAVIAMLGTNEVAPGVRIDTRAIMVGMAGAFAGVSAGLVAGAIAAAFRYWLGGAGAVVGMFGIAIATLAGIGWLKLLPRRRRDSLSGLLLLALAIAVHSLLAFLAPWVGTSFLALYFPLIWGTCLVATLALGWMMQRENALILREASLADFAFTDALTGLANRRAFERRLLNRDVQSENARFSIVVLDVDHFKQINDRHGHDAGDAVLRGIARTIQDDIRQNDMVARHGGEEFVILLPKTDLAEGQAAADRIRTRIARDPFPFPGGSVGVTVSLGVAATIEGGSPKGILVDADTALYAAKAAGRNRVRVAGAS